MKVHAPKTKLTPRERRHSKQVATLTRWHKKREAAIKTIAKSERIIPRLEKALQRYDKLMAFGPLDMKTEPTVPPTPQVGTSGETNAGLDIPEFLRRKKLGDMTPEEADKAIASEPKVGWVFPAKPKAEPPKLKAPRKRKPKGDDPLAEMIG